ncbi:hypothetical protein ND861_19595, partial [Leptospira sp. 2 VSF19]
SLNTLTFTDDYYKLLKINKPIDKPQWQSRRDYLIPSLNRDEKIEISCVIIKEFDEPPVISVSTDTKGLKLDYKEEKESILGESILGSLIVGFIISILFSISVYLNIESRWFSLLLVFIFGSTGTIIGAIFLKLFNRIKKILS